MGSGILEEKPSFFVHLERYEVRNRAGSGLFFILMTFSNLNFKNMLRQ
jgi:hypothetical protein